MKILEITFKDHTTKGGKGTKQISKVRNRKEDLGRVTLLGTPSNMYRKVNECLVFLSRIIN